MSSPSSDVRIHAFASSMPRSDDIPKRSPVILQPAIVEAVEAGMKMAPLLHAPAVLSNIVLVGFSVTLQ